MPEYLISPCNYVGHTELAHIHELSVYRGTVTCTQRTRIFRTPFLGIACKLDLILRIKTHLEMSSLLTYILKLFTFLLHSVLTYFDNPCQGLHF